MTLLLDQRGGDVPITEGVVMASVGNWGASGKEIMTLLLDQRGGDALITEGAVEAAARNWRHGGKEIIALLPIEEGATSQSLKGWWGQR